MSHRRRPSTGGRSQGKARVELNLTPMIDVVFQLLIYFLLGTSFAVGEQTFRLDVPDRGDAFQVDPFELDVTPVVVKVAGEGRIRVDGPWNGPVHVEALTTFLEARRIDRGGLLPIDTPIHVDPLPGVDWGEAVEVFNAAVRAGFESVGFIDASSGANR